MGQWLESSGSSNADHDKCWPFPPVPGVQQHLAHIAVEEGEGNNKCPIDTAACVGQAECFGMITM